MNPKYKWGLTLIRVPISPVLPGFCVFRHSFLIFCTLLMASHTRQSHALGANGHKEAQLSESPGILQVATITSVQGRSQRENRINMASPNANPPGESDISLSYPHL